MAKCNKSFLQSLFIAMKLKLPIDINLNQKLILGIKEKTERQR